MSVPVSWRTLRHLLDDLDREDRERDPGSGALDREVVLRVDHGGRTLVCGLRGVDLDRDEDDDRALVLDGEVVHALGAPLASVRSEFWSCESVDFMVHTGSVSHVRLSSSGRKGEAPASCLLEVVVSGGDRLQQCFADRLIAERAFRSLCTACSMVDDDGSE